MSLTKKAAPLKYARADADAWIDFMNESGRNVRQYGAQGNDTGNDAVFIQAAIDETVANGGGIVYMPPGTYRMTTPLRVGNGVTLAGAGFSTARGLEGVGTWLHAVNTGALLAAPLIRVTGYGERLTRFAVVYDQPPPGVGWAPTAYPYAIQCAGDGGMLANDIEISDVYLSNATNGIQLGVVAGGIAVGRILVSRVSGQVFGIGIKGEYIQDIVRIEHIHWWPFWSVDSNVLAYTKSNTVSLQAEKWDNPMIHDFFSIFHRIGLHLTSNAFGYVQRLQANNVQIDGCGAYGIFVPADLVTAQINNFVCEMGGMAGSSGAVVAGNDVHLQLANYYPANVGRCAVYMSGASRVSISNLRADIWSQEAGNFAALWADNANAVISLDAGTTFSRSYPPLSLTVPATAPDVQGPGQVLQPGYAGAVHLTHSVVIPIAHNTSIILPFDTEVVDTDGLHSTTVNNSRVTVKRAGRYAVTICVSFAYTAAAGVRTVHCMKNGLTVGGVTSVGSYTSTTNTPALIAHMTEVRCAIGDYIEAVTFHDLGSSVNLLVETGRSPEMRVSYLGT